MKTERCEPTLGGYKVMLLGAKQKPNKTKADLELIKEFEEYIASQEEPKALTCPHCGNDEINLVVTATSTYLLFIGDDGELDQDWSSSSEEGNGSYTCNQCQKEVSEEEITKQLKA